jgi:hypothetical protein
VELAGADGAAEVHWVGVGGRPPVGQRRSPPGSGRSPYRASRPVPWGDPYMNPEDYAAFVERLYREEGEMIRRLGLRIN